MVLTEIPERPVTQEFAEPKGSPESTDAPEAAVKQEIKDGLVRAERPVHRDHLGKTWKANPDQMEKPEQMVDPANLDGMGKMDLVGHRDLMLVTHSTLVFGDLPDFLEFLSYSGVPFC